MSEQPKPLDLEAIEKRTVNYPWSALEITVRTDVPALIAEVRRLRAAERERDAERAVSRARENALAGVMRERDEARTERDRYAARERRFALGLRVADAGQYREDWPGAVERCIRERDAAQAALAEVRALAKQLAGASSKVVAQLHARARNTHFAANVAQDEARASRLRSAAEATLEAATIASEYVDTALAAARALGLRDDDNPTTGADGRKGE